MSVTVKQRILLRLYDFYVRQGKPLGWDEEQGVCLYIVRDEAGREITRCGIGCLLHDYAIPEKWNGKAVTDVALRFKQQVGDKMKSVLLHEMEKNGYWEDKSGMDYFLTKLQRQHDKCAYYEDKEDFVNWLRHRFEDEGLQWPN